MNKKLILAAIAVTLSVGCAQATNITGVTGSGGVYNVTPEKFSGNAAYRKYDNFVLDQGHVANLDFQDREGHTTNAFVNLVGSKVQINGLLNSVKNNKFYNGHAVFITPGGFVVGSSGVINVGRLSVATPTTETYNKLFKDTQGNNYGDENFDYAGTIGRRISKLTYNNDSSLPAGAAEVTINGKVFAVDRVEATGSKVTVGGNIVNGVKHAASENPLTTEEAATALFEQLVNTNGTVKDASKFEASGGRIRLKSTTDDLAVIGTITNGVGDVYLTNEGANGMAISGKVAGQALTRAFNEAGALNVANGAELNATKIVVNNKGTALTLASGAKATGGNRVELITQGTGALTASGQVNANGALVVKNSGAGGMTLDGTFTNASGQTAINNLAGDMLIDGTFNNTGNMGVINKGNGAVVTKNATITNTGKLKIANTGADGLTFVGDVDNNGELRIYNDNGKLTFGTDSAGTKAAQINNKNGKLYIAARKNATGIAESTTANITNENGNLVIRNSGTKVASGARGLDLQGGVQAKGNGTVAINNDMGDMYVSSNVQVANGNLGIINRAGGNEMTLASAGVINVANGNANIKNFGTGDMTVNSTISHTGRMNVLANKGALNLGATVHNESGQMSNNATGRTISDNNGFYAAARKNGTGVNVTSAFVVDGNGEVLIKNISGEDGLKFAGTINTTNQQAALVNHKGNMNVSGSIKTTNAPIVVSNKGAKLTVASTANLNSGTEGNLFDNGSETASVSSSATLKNMKGHGKLKDKI